MKLIIWLLDLNEETTQGRTEIHLWAHTNEGNSTLVIDRNLQPYIYLLLNGEKSLNEVVEAVGKVTQNQIEKIEPVQRRYYGREVEALKLTVKNTEIINKYASYLAKLPGVREVLEDDLRHSQRYLIHYQARPCHWHEIEVKEAERRFTAGVDYVYEALSPPSPLQLDVPPHLRILAFHMICYSQRGTPRPERDPVTIISTSTN
ncbi:MAG: 3'-5' exonuclease, partial [Candidatus Bathyarchaeia archaeon]